MKRSTKVLIGLAIAVVGALALYYGGGFLISQLIEMHRG